MQTPRMIMREYYMHIIAYNLIRSVMQDAAHTHDADLSRLSFRGSLDTVRHFATAAHGVENQPRLLTKPRHEMGPIPHRKDGVEKNPEPALT